MLIKDELHKLFENDSYATINKLYGKDFLENYQDYDFEIWNIFCVVKEYLKCADLEKFYSFYLNYLFGLGQNEMYVEVAEKKFQLFKKLGLREFYHLSLCYYQLGQFTKFLTASEQVLTNASTKKHYNIALQMSQFILQYDPKNIKAHFVVFFVYCCLNKVEECHRKGEEIFEKIIRGYFQSKQQYDVEHYLDKLMENLSFMTELDFKLESFKKVLFLYKKTLKTGEMPLQIKDVLETIIAAHDDVRIYVFVYKIITNERVREKLAVTIKQFDNYKEIIQIYAPEYRDMICGHKIVVKKTLPKNEDSILVEDIKFTSSHSDSLMLDDFVENLDFSEEYTSVVNDIKKQYQLTEKNDPKNSLDAAMIFMQMKLYELSLEILRSLDETEESLYLKFEIYLRTGRYVDLVSEIVFYQSTGILGKKLSKEFRYLMAMAYKKLGKKILAKKIFTSIVLEDPEFRLSKENI